MKTSCIASLLGIGILAVVLGCSSDDDSGGASGSSGGGSAGAGGSSGSAGAQTGGGGSGGSESGGSAGAETGGSAGAETGGSAGQGGSGTVPSFVSNTPSAQVNETTTGDASDLVLVNSNLLDEPSGGQYFQRWLGEVFNKGTEPVCQARIDIEFLAGGSSVASFFTFADSVAYESSTPGLVMQCIEPGASGFFYSNAFSSSALQPSSITTVNVEISGSIHDNVSPSSCAPQLESANVVEPYGAGMGYWAVQGTIRGAGATINGISVDVYPKDAQGLVIDKLSDINSGSLAVGSTWDFDTTAAEAAFVDYSICFDYMIESSYYSLDLDKDISLPESFEKQRRAWKREVQLRRDLHLSR